MKEVKKSKNSTRENSFYLSILNELNLSTNLINIRNKLGISKQLLNYYLRGMRKSGLIINRSSGLWEVLEGSKKLTKYGILLTKDTIRGHAYIISVKPKKFPENWSKRIEILEKRGINYKLVGAKETTPRIKVLGRKVWLCNNRIRIFDKKGESYYGLNAIESRKQAFWGLYKVVSALENKLGLNFRPLDFEWRKEHYALIKNDLAIDQNQKGIIWRIKDGEGEWLLIDDSLGEGGELENIGKASFRTNIPMQRWWNDQKKTKFEVTPNFILNTMNGIQQNQLVFDRNMKSHLEVLGKLGRAVDKLTEKIEGFRK